MTHRSSNRTLKARWLEFSRIGAVGTFVVLLYWFAFSANKASENEHVSGRLKMLAFAFLSYAADNGEFPQRAIEGADEVLVSWRSKIIVESSRIYLPAESHPIYCKKNNLTRFLAVDYPNSPWGMQADSLAGEPQMLATWIEVQTIPWASPGDIVLKKPSEYPFDVKEQDFMILNQKTFLVGFTDGTTRSMTKDEMLRCALSDGRL